MPKMSVRVREYRELQQEVAVLRERLSVERANNADLERRCSYVASEIKTQCTRLETLIRNALRLLEPEPNNPRMQQAALYLREIVSDRPSHQSCDKPVTPPTDEAH